jgi:hypothetical protein
VILDIAKTYDTVTGPSYFASWRLLGADDPCCGGSSSCSATLMHTPLLVVMCPRPKSGKLVSVRAALCLPSLTLRGRSSDMLA